LPYPGVRLLVIATVFDGPARSVTWHIVILPEGLVMEVRISR